MTAAADKVDHDSVLAFKHIGDLHLTDVKQRNFTDFLSIVAQIEIEGATTIDFVVLPGDNADNGKRSQYVLAATALKMLSVPVHVLPGDHDLEQGSLAAFREVLAPTRCHVKVPQQEGEQFRLEHRLGGIGEGRDAQRSRNPLAGLGQPGHARGGLGEGGCQRVQQSHSGLGQR